MVKIFLSTFVYDKRHLSNKGFKLAILSLQVLSAFDLHYLCKKETSYRLHNVEDVGKNKKTVRI